jgi:small subunit ribosomal protein S14
MASKAKIAMNKKRMKLAAKYADRRAALRKIMKDEDASFEEKAEAQAKLLALPRNSAAVRIRNRCAVTGRPRAYYRKFGLCRNMLRELGLQGAIPGLTKSSW